MDSRQRLYDQIEAKYGFKLPAEYVALSDRGRFDFKGPAANNAALIAGPYMWLHDMEWRPLADIANKKIRMAKPEFTSFAFSGGGDQWCWYPAATIGDRVPVVQCPRDSIEGEFYAPDFIHSLYRQVLDFALYAFGENEELDRQYLDRWSRELGPMLPRPCAGVLARLCTAPVRKVPADAMHYQKLLSQKEYDKIVKRDLKFDRLGEQIIWMED